MFNTANTLNQLINRENLSPETMSDFMTELMSGQLAAPAAAALLTGLRAKGETLDEIVAAARVMRDFSNRVEVADNSGFVDIVGTGGDGVSTFNISTTCLFVVAAAGAKVAKHGNRSVSSKSGSADALEALGVNLTLTPAQVGECIAATGIGFMFAPNHHPAMRHISPIRKELGVRTLFNMIGPLANPANAPYMLMGVFSRHLLPVMSEALRQLGTKRALVVHSEDGMDEVSIFAPTYVSELKDGHIREYMINPNHFNFDYASIHDIRVQSPEQSIEMMKSALSGAPSAARDIVLMNSGVALYTLGMCKTIEQGVDKAREVIDSGKPLEKIAEYVAFTQQFKE